MRTMNVMQYLQQSHLQSRNVVAKEENPTHTKALLEAQQTLAHEEHAS